MPPKARPPKARPARAKLALLPYENGADLAQWCAEEFVRLAREGRDVRDTIPAKLAADKAFVDMVGRAINRLMGAP